MLELAGICVTDLDGTLLNSERCISPVNIETLRDLGNRGITRIIATGRSLYSMDRVLPSETPIDYAIFSTGAGIMDWHSRNIIHSVNLNSFQIRQIMTLLDAVRFDYAIHHPIPETHRFFYVQSEGSEDFTRRCEYYAEFALPLTEASHIRSATQFLAITDPRRKDEIAHLRRKLSPMTLIRTTSPLDLRSLWIEIFAPGVNKGSAVLSLADKLHCPRSKVMILGNDYNDLEMLRLGGAAYVTANAPEDMRKEFTCVSHHDEDAFAEAVTNWLDKL